MPPPGASMPAAQQAAPAPTPAAAPAMAASPARQAAPAPTARPAPRRRARAARQLPPPKICTVQVNAPKGQDRAAALSECIKK
ncbi:MAG: hypothetical protein KA295_01275 [Giesbergeria sp.]|nr:hypothetical protein [Giesbergeria sp.]MBP6374950.1 hypothetical protein [Giesbergeria sp.]